MNSQANIEAPLAGQYLSFTLGGEEYGVDILRVQEIKGWEPVRQLPDTPDYLKGVLDLRGEIVPIVDLRSRFKLARADYSPTTVTIVLALRVEQGQQVIGIVVDGVSDVLDVQEVEVRPAPELGVQVNNRYIVGMVNRGERMVVLLDADRLFHPDELVLADLVV